jgi:arsenate reductase (thioredoxin)
MQKPRVLFVCVGNAARSQMAEAWLRHLAGDNFEALSAGTYPIGVSPHTVKAMEEVGLDISAARSKSVDDVPGPFEYVVTTCAEAEADCPHLHGTIATVHWHVPDPVTPAMGAHSEEERREIFRRARARLRQRVEEFLSKYDA